MEDEYSPSTLTRDDLIEIALVDDYTKDPVEEVLYWYRAQVHQVPKGGRGKFVVKHLDRNGKLVHRTLPNDSTLWRPVRSHFVVVVVCMVG